MPMLLQFNNYVLPDADEWYPAEFKKVEEVDSQFGKRLKWLFELMSDDEDLDGESVNGYTSTKISNKSNAGQYFFLPMTSMTVDEAAEGDDPIDFEDYYGDEFEVFIEHNETDKGTFANVTKVRVPKAKAKVGGKNKGKTADKPKSKPAPKDEDPLGDDDTMPDASDASGDVDTEDDIPI